MKRFGPAAVLRAVIAVGSATPATAQQRAHAAVQQSSLDNGLQVLVVENHTAPLATVLVAVRTGAMTQGAGDRGLAHLYEHLLFRTYGSDPSFGVDATSLDAVYNGTTGQEVVTYFLMLPSKNAVKGIGLLAKLLQKARFSDYDLRQELPVVLNELQRAESDPDQALERQAEQRLWGPDWSRKDIGGDSATLKAITIGRLQETYARYYVPNNAALVVTGDVAAEEVLAAARERFGTWQRAPDPFVEHPIPPIGAMTGSTATLVAQPVAHARIAITLRGPSVAQDTAATYAADALCDVLNDPGSAFHRRLVGTGLFQSVSCRYQTLVHVGPISFEGETTPAKATAALTTLLAELDQVGRLEGVTDEDLSIAKQRRRVRAALAFEASSALAPSLAHWWASGGVGYYEGFSERVNAQGMDDLRRFAQAYIVTRPRVIAVLAPRVVIERLRAQLRAASAPNTP
ncbi:MAG TPA: pitrilysin family protein [Gemmatimonadales bacterium]|nr:pitrilysin family protein [Gemmatimonadales bacterium]